jgi:hypothetical protein
MRIALVSIFVLHVISSFGQQTEAQDLAEKKALNKVSNYNFLQQTLNYAALSYICPTGLDRGSPKEWYILSADIIPQFVIGGEWTRFTAHLTARYQVRILHNNKVAGDSSLPVRTPSFMPGATVYYALHRTPPEAKSLNYVSLSVFHHSNGQDGNELKENGDLNLYNGNFSTNYLEPAYNFRRRYFDKIIMAKKICEDARPNYLDLYGRVGYEIHFNTTDELKSSYGTQRLNFLLGFIRVRNYCDYVKGNQINLSDTTINLSDNTIQVGDSYYRERYRTVFSATLIGGSRDRGLSDLKHRLNVDLSFHYRIPSSPNTSAFFGFGYMGSDTYNIYYEQNYFYVRAGIALGFFVAPNIVGSKRTETTQKRYIQKIKQ